MVRLKGQLIRLEGDPTLSFSLFLCASLYLLMTFDIVRTRSRRLVRHIRIVLVKGAEGISLTPDSYPRPHTTWLMVQTNVFPEAYHDIL